MTNYRRWEEVRQYFSYYYVTAPYYQPGRDWKFYEDAYRLGWSSAIDPAWRSLSWKEAEPRLKRRWQALNKPSVLWQAVRPAVRDAWERAHSHWHHRTDDFYGFIWNRAGHLLLRHRLPAGAPKKSGA